jgi:hypothetical protein
MQTIQLSSVEQIKTGTILLKAKGLMGNKYFVVRLPDGLLFIPFATLNERFCPLLSDWYITTLKDFSRYLREKNTELPLSIVVSDENKKGYYTLRRPPKKLH